MHPAGHCARANADVHAVQTGKVMAKKFRTTRKLLRRSDYQDALVRYHAARRRGDSADAQRWLKTADMHLRVAHRFDEGVHRSLVRDSELLTARAAAEAAVRRKEDCLHRPTTLDDVMRQMEADFAAGWEPDMPTSSPAVESESAGEPR
jgi:hypothetical protein